MWEKWCSSEGFYSYATVKLWVQSRCQKLGIHSKKIWQRYSLRNPDTHATCNCPACTRVPALARSCTRVLILVHSCTCVPVLARSYTHIPALTCSCTGHNSASCFRLSRSGNLPLDHCSFPSLTLHPSLAQTILLLAQSSQGIAAQVSPPSPHRSLLICSY